jgi:hypothetical protein
MERFHKEWGYFVISNVADKEAKNYVHVLEFKKAFCGMSHKVIHKSYSQEIYLIRLKSGKELEDIRNVHRNLHLPVRPNWK